MKHTVLWVSFIFLSACTTLPLSREAKEESSLLADYAAVSYAQRTGDKSQWDALEKLLARAPQSVYLRQRLVAQAVADGTPEKAQPYLDFIEQENPSAQDYQVYASYQAAMKDYRGAADSYEKAVTQDPDNDELLYQYITLLAGIDLDKAIEKMEQLAAQNPPSAADIYVEIGRLYARRKNWEKAMAYFNKALEKDADNLNARLGRAGVYELNFQYFLMMHELEEIEKRGYATADIYNRMASFYVLVKDMDKAEEYFLKTYEKDPTEPAACYFLAALAEYNQQYDKAISYTKSGADYPTTASKWVQVAFYQQKLNQPDEMLHTLQTAYERFEDNVEVGYFYALALNDRKDYKTAAKVLSKLLETSPEYDEARMHYAYALENLKKYKEEEKQLQILLERNPQYAPALNLYAYSLAQRNERLDEAQGYISRALAVNPDDYSFVDTQAWVWVRQGKWAEADELLSSIPLPVVQRNAEIAYHLGVLRHHQGKREEALQYLQMAKDEWPDAATLFKQLSR